VRDAALLGADFVALNVLAPWMARVPLLKFVTTAQMATTASHGVAC
jgi:hypothetical protein